MKSSTIALVLILSFSGSIGHSQTPPSPSPVLAITGTNISADGKSSAFPEGTLAQYSVPGSANTAFFIFPIGSGSSYATSDGVFVFTAPAGPYQLLAATTNSSNKIVFLTLAITITPSSIPSTPLAIAIFDSSQLTSLPAGQIAIYTSKTIASSLANQGITYLKYDISDYIPSTSGTGSSPLLSTKWGTSASSVGFPALVLVNGSKINPIVLPADEASAITAATSGLISKKK